MKKLTFFTIAILSIGISVNAQSTYPVNSNQDIIHYTFTLGVSDTSNVIYGEAEIHFKTKDQNYLVLDLVGEKDEKGMMVDYILGGSDTLEYLHQNNRLKIKFDDLSEPPSQITIKYHGVPANGLLIDNNKFGERVFFGDNYPDRARHWLPTVDHPSDKATVTWIVKAPDHYRVIGNGQLESIEDGMNGYSTTTWEEDIPISTKVMVFAAANFSIDESGIVNGVPVSTWVYQQNEKDGFYDFAIAPKVLAYFDSLLAPHPYEKLAHVQSKTMYGGMENAGNIFYFEDVVNGKAERENLIAHETIHQWFGNSATEADWSHAWLSEGFATYLTHVYVQSKVGEEEFMNRLKRDRERIIKYWYKKPLPVVNSNLVTYPKVKDLRELLSANTYQKGGWFLHMLKEEIGEETFWNSVRKYYNDHKNSIATTSDFQKVVEKVSGKDLHIFFNQWLYADSHPQLEGNWYYKKGSLYVTITQKQDKLFKLTMELAISKNNEQEVIKVEVGQKKETFIIKRKRPESIIIDPNVKLLYEGESQLLVKKR